LIGLATGTTRDWTDDPLSGAVFDATGPGTVRRLMSRDGWIVVGVNEEGDFLSVEMDPGPAGRPGRVIIIGGDYDGAPAYVADSVTTLLRRRAEALERRDYYLRHEYMCVNADSTKSTSADSTRQPSRPRPDDGVGRG
jgi:cell wall assembly regulator SMI1